MAYNPLASARLILYSKIVLPLTDTFQNCSKCKYMCLQTTLTLYQTTKFETSPLKELADDILNVVQMMIYVTIWVENIVGKG